MANYNTDDTSAHEEWLADYGRAAGNTIAKVQPTKQTPLETAFRYVCHRTTSRGSVVLEFQALESNLTAVLFFNVGLHGKRGKAYPAKAGGQFDPPKRGSFRKFWLDAVGKQPYRWSRVHKSMRSALGDLVFKGQYKRATAGNGEPYFKITSIRTA